VMLCFCIGSAYGLRLQAKYANLDKKGADSCNQSQKFNASRAKEIQSLKRHGDTFPNGAHALPDECALLNPELNHELNIRFSFGVPNQLDGPIIEFGGNVGGDLHNFVSLHSCNQIFSYEPLPWAFQQLSVHPDVVQQKGRVHIVNAGVGGKSENVTFFGGGGQEEAASMYLGQNVNKRNEKWILPLVDIVEVLEFVQKESGNNPAALSFNCEGCEYPSLLRFVQSSWLGKVKYLQVSWHLEKDIADRHQKRCQITKALKGAGYVQTYYSYFGWEGWALSSALPNNTLQ